MSDSLLSTPLSPKFMQHVYLWLLMYSLWSPIQLASGVDCHIPRTSHRFDVYPLRGEKSEVDCCIKCHLATVLPIVLSIIDTTISGRLFGSSFGSVFLSISVCFVGLHEVLNNQQKHSCCWVLNPRRMLKPDLTYLAPNRRQYASEWRCKKNLLWSHCPSCNHRRRSGHHRRKNRRQSFHARDGKGL